MTSSVTSSASFMLLPPMVLLTANCAIMSKRFRTEIFTVKNAAKIQLLGAQDQKFYLEFDNRQLAGLGVTHDQIIQTLREQKRCDTLRRPSRPARRNSPVRVSGSFNSIEDLKRIQSLCQRQVFRLADVATIKEGYADPPQPMFRYNGESAIGLAISMLKAATTSSSARP